MQCGGGGDGKEQEEMESVLRTLEGGEALCASRGEVRCVARKFMFLLFLRSVLKVS